MERISLISLMEGLGRSSLQAAVLVIVVLAAQWILRKQLSPRWRCALWLLVIARLLLPVSIVSTASIFNLLPHWAGGDAAMPGATATRPSLDQGRMAPLPVPAVEERFVQQSSAPATQASTAPQTAQPANPPSRPSAVPPTTIRRSQLLSWANLSFGAWICGVFAMGGYLLFASLSLSRKITGLKPLSEPGVLGVLEECRSLMKVRSHLKVVESSAVSCPALYGLLRPRLVLPAHFSGKFSERELRFIFLHELAHVKRFDLPVNWVIACLQVLHWFNPLIWIGFARWRADRELACDAMALDAAGANQNSAYGQTILRLLAEFTRAAATPGLVGILESKHQLRRRIGMIATYTPSGRWQLLALLVAAAIGITGLTDAQIQASKSTARKDRMPMTSSSQSNQAIASSSRPVVTNGPVMKVLVLDDETGKPLEGAEVLAPNQAAFFNGQEHAPLWLTDKDGQATIRLGEVPANHLSEQSWFTLSVRHKGFAPRGMSWSASNKDVRPSLPQEVRVRLKKGISVGGTVQDEKGMPVAGVQVRIFGTAYWEGLKAEYPEYWTDGPGRPVVATDEQGHFQAKDFPADLNGVVVELSREDGVFQRFRKPYPGWEEDPRDPGDPIDLAAFRAGRAVFVLKSGFEVQGLVLDPEGRPVSNLLVKAGTGTVNHQRLFELRTDAAGRFKLSHLLRRQLILTAYPTNFAISSTVVDVSQKAPEVHLSLASQQPLRIRVVDGEGNPIKGAQVSVDGYRTEAQMLDFSGQTDASGALIWTNAPVSSFALVATSTSPRCRQKIRVTPSEREITFNLRKGMNEEVIVTGQVRDAKSGQVLELESAHYRAAGGFKGFEFAGDIKNDGFRVAIPATRFTPGGMYPSYQIELQVKGYGLLVTPWRDFDEGDWQASFVMQPPTVSSRTILLPNGKPAANARVWTRADMNDGFLYYNQPPNGFSDDRLIRLRADANGRFNLPEIPDEEPLLIAHPDGFLETSRSEVNDKPVLRLQHWGSIKGTLKVGSQPKAGVRVNLTTLLSSPWALFVSVLTTTEADGSFAFNQVPAGEYKIWRYPTAAARRSGPITADHQMPVSVRPGEVVNVQYGGTGRPVIGQAKPDKPGIAVDWLHDDHTLTLKQRPTHQLSVEDFADSKTYMQAYREHSVSPEMVKAAREARTYVLEFEADGSFRAEDVPPGDYELSIQIHKPGEEQQFVPFGSPKGDLGSLTRDIVVPAGEGPFDLGTLIVPVQGQPGVKKAEPVTLDATTLEGEAISLGQFKGKYLVVAFWASWSDRSLDGLGSFEKLRAQFEKDPQIQFLTVSLDQNLQDARKVTEGKASGCKQAWLSPAKAARVTTAFDINTLPAVFLIDPEGRILGRDLEGERLPTMLNRALAAK